MRITKGVVFRVSGYPLTSRKNYNITYATTQFINSVLNDDLRKTKRMDYWENVDSNIVADYIETMELVDCRWFSTKLVLRITLELNGMIRNLLSVTHDYDRLKQHQSHLKNQNGK